MNKQIFRIIDANLNRAREGLRVCEEITRFVLEDKLLTGKFKNLRHRLSKNINKLPGVGDALLQSRESKKDIGRSIANRSKRKDYRDVFYANIQRTEESLRVLEEFSKIFNRSLSEHFACLRFEAYNLEKKTIARL
ncbi:MAG: thiamine-phosphate pyrophosphorylase [Candidatus Omnitrophica bacterium]|nr:thiamine-phosphate pyrophosphorylase [Candidatus Omnitrophota bacterium]